MLRSLVGLTILCLFTTLTVGTAQDPAPVKVQRTHHPLRTSDATVLAEILSKHFKGEAEVLAAPKGATNALLISASPATTAEILKLLAQLDQEPRMVEVEIITTDLFSKKSPFEKENDEMSFTGPAEEIFTRLDALKKNGQLGTLNRFKVGAVDGQVAKMTVGGNKPFRVGGGGGKGGFGGQATYNYQPQGTTLAVTPRIATGDVVLVELDLKQERTRSGDAPGAAGGDEPAEFVSTTLATKVSVAPGRAVVARAVRTEEKSGPTIGLVIVTARIVNDR